MQSSGSVATAVLNQPGGDRAVMGAGWYLAPAGGGFS
jgi:hypothetical protein